MVEMLVVLVIMAIAAMLVVPMFSSAEGMQLHAAANMIAADLEYAKSMAIGTQRTYTVVFDKTSESYQIEDSGGVIEHPVKRGFDYVVNFSSDHRLDKVDIVEVNFGASSQVGFDYFGSPDNAGFVRLQVGSDVAIVNVNSVTGFITVTE